MRLRCCFAWVLSLVLGGGIAQAAPTPAASLLVLAKKDMMLAIVDPATLQVVARVPVGVNPHEVIASSDGRTAWVTNYDNGSAHTVTVVDLVAQKVVKTIDLGAVWGPHGLAVAAGKTYFTAERSKLVGRIDQATETVDWVLGVGQIGTHMLWVSADGKRIVTANVGSGTISILEQKDPAAWTMFPTMLSKSGGTTMRGKDGPLAPDWSEIVVAVETKPEGFDVLTNVDGYPRIIWAANAVEGSISVIDVGEARGHRDAGHRPANGQPAALYAGSHDGRRLDGKRTAHRRCRRRHTVREEAHRGGHGRGGRADRALRRARLRFLLAGQLGSRRRSSHAHRDRKNPSRHRARWPGVGRASLTQHAIVRSKALKTIGLIGGMSWESSADYYRLTNQLVRQRMGGLASAKSVLVSMNFAEIAALQRAGDWDALTDRMVEAARQVEAGGADFLLLCTNTMHKVSAAMEAAVGIPMIHIIEPVAAAIQRSGLQRVGLLGTRYTMEDGFYADRMRERHGIEILTPSPEDRTMVHDAIFEELCRGVLDEATRERFCGVFARMAAAGAEGIILGCTELGLLLGAADCSVPLFDSTRLHAEAAVDRALAC